MIRVRQLSVYVPLVLMVLTGVASADVKVAIVDLQRILSESIRGKEAKDLLEKEAERKKEIIETKKEELQKLIEEFEKQQLVLSEKARADKQRLIDEKSSALREMIIQYQQELQKKDQELTRSIINEVSGIVEEIAKRYGFTLVVEKNEGGILYFKNGLDITDKVLKEYDKRVKKRSR